MFVDCTRTKAYLCTSLNDGIDQETNTGVRNTWPSLTSTDVFRSRPANEIQSHRISEVVPTSNREL